MAKKATAAPKAAKCATSCCTGWVCWVTLIVGILYLLGSWFNWPWVFTVFRFEGMLFLLIGLWAVTKK